MESSETPQSIEIGKPIKPFEGVKPDQDGIYTSRPYVYEDVGQFTFYASPKLESETTRPVEELHLPHTITAALVSSNPITEDMADAISTQLLITFKGGFVPQRGITHSRVDKYDIDPHSQLVTKMVYSNWNPARGESWVEDSNKPSKDNIVRIHPNRQRPVVNPLILSKLDLPLAEFDFLNVVKPNQN